MSKRLRETVQKIPLLCKAVSLYVLAFLPLHFLVLQTPAESLDTNRYISEIVQIDALAPAAEPEVISGTPDRLVIERLGIDLPIEDGLYDRATDTWTLSDEAVHFAVMTTLPNTEAGHTLIYGHNNRNLLAPTRDIRPGDLLEIVAKDGKTFTYRYVRDVSVDPNDTQILAAAPDTPQLTLLTCEGLWNEKRRLMSFAFVEAALPPEDVQ